MHAAASFTTTPPRLVTGEEREDVGDRRTARRCAGDVRQEHEADAQLRGERVQPPPLAPRAREDENQPWVGRSRDRPHERVRRLLGREPRDGQDGDVLRRQARIGPQVVAVRAEPVGLRAELGGVDGVSEQRDPLGEDAPRSIDSRASLPTTSTSAAPRTIGGTTTAFTARRQPGLGSRSFDSTRRTYGTWCSRHQAVAACEANVLHPETTTTSGIVPASARNTPSEIGYSCRSAR